jgi:hypothetical protein
VFPVSKGMNEWKPAVKQALISGASASLLSAITLALCGRAENGRAAGPINGPSQWVFGRRAAYVRGASLRHTLVGFLVHHTMSTGWALLHERLFGRGKHNHSLAKRVARGAVTAAVANLVDFQVAPTRLRPGFEVQLSRKALFLVYAAFAVGLAATLHSAGGEQRR